MHARPDSRDVAAAFKAAGERFVRSAQDFENAIRDFADAAERAGLGQDRFDADSRKRNEVAR